MYRNYSNKWDKMAQLLLFINALMRRTHFNEPFLCCKDMQMKEKCITESMFQFSRRQKILKMAPTIDIRYSVWIRWLNSVSMFVGLATQQKRLFINACYQQSGPFQKKMSLCTSHMCCNVVACSSVQNSTWSIISLLSYFIRDHHFILLASSRASHTLWILRFECLELFFPEEKLIQTEAIKCSQWCVSFLVALLLRLRCISN